MLPIFIVLAFAAGCAISVQAAVNAQLAAGFGGNVFGAAFYSFATGTIALGIIASVQGGLPTALTTIPSQPFWKLIGGLLGAGAIFSTILITPKIGLANLLILVITGQLVTSLVIDNFGLLNSALRPVTAIKFVGALLVICGALITLFGDRMAAWTGNFTR
ncbi:DMT family transporter (plasmid) [Sinorhizobium mexicanum]|uniref:DMT family transporter n=2 Tax=Sinorhizobium mexicanum TaxID=375549 RepID=A0A859RAG2_9HYPH|nr:DMT family transporter [Sinorhizobium mexicanum]QLL66258.1 DMT family transporter [Sinorhizobium mexicanum]